MAGTLCSFVRFSPNKPLPTRLKSWESRIVASPETLYVFHTNVVAVGSHRGRIFLTSLSFFVGSDLGVWFQLLGGDDWQRASIDSFQAYRRARTSRIGQGTQHDRRVYRRLLGRESLVVERRRLKRKRIRMCLFCLPRNPRPKGNEMTTILKLILGLSENTKDKINKCTRETPQTWFVFVCVCVKNVSSLCFKQRGFFW